MFSIDFYTKDELKSFPALGSSQTETIDVSDSEDLVFKSCAIDQFPAQDFNLNDAGWPRNIISELAHAQSKAEYDMILSRIQELRTEYSIPDDMDTETAISLIKPRYYQSANEFEQYAKKAADYDLKLYKEAVAAKESVKPVAESAPAAEPSTE